MITVSYSIGIMGVVRLREAADPKKSKFLLELPRFTFAEENLTETKFGRLASTNENKNIGGGRSSHAPESAVCACTLEIVERSGLLDQSSSTKQIL